MRALSLRQPWAHAIAHLGKRIENRTWPPPAWLVGHQIAIHAGKKLDEYAAEILTMELGLDGAPQFALGAVVATATVKGWVDAISVDHPQHYWFNGPCGWVLDNVAALPSPVECRGFQKLWWLPPDVEAAVVAQL